MLVVSLTPDNSEWVLATPNYGEPYVRSGSTFHTPGNSEWVLAMANYGEAYMAAVRKGNVQAVQFHPEKSGGEWGVEGGKSGVQSAGQRAVSERVRKGNVQ
ncbi:unnamed protein product [Closterium sp. Naga37s-1]|nr:unnamed protein product [Closterium sp. Naga37s-1]